MTKQPSVQFKTTIRNNTLTSTIRCRKKRRLAALQFCLVAVMRKILLCCINKYVTPLSYTTGSWDCGSPCNNSKTSFTIQQSKFSTPIPLLLT